MRQTFLAAAAAFVIGGIATGAVLSMAQPAQPAAPPAGQPPPAAFGDAPGPRADAPPPRPWMGWGHRMHMAQQGQPGGRWGDRPGGMGPGGWHHGGPMHGMRAFALIFRQQDRALAPADVQKIAEAFLLWNGNHTWKVTEVAATPTGPVAFSLTTPEGSVVARFTMDPHTGRVRRIG